MIIFIILQFKLKFILLFLVLKKVRFNAVFVWYVNEM